MSLLLILSLALAPSPERVFHTVQVHGWTVWMEARELDAHPMEMDSALVLLGDQLLFVSRALPADLVEPLRETAIWLSFATATPCAAFHPDRAWLVERAYDPPPPKSLIEVGNARNFLAWTKEQPWMLLHELAHAFDFSILGEGRRYDTQSKSATFESAQKGGSYESVLRASGKFARHYALSNPMEYLAENVEAFFGVNDFYPFVRAQLREHDPQGLAYVAALTGADCTALDGLATKAADAPRAALPSGIESMLPAMDELEEDHQSGDNLFASAELDPAVVESARRQVQAELRNGIRALPEGALGGEARVQFSLLGPMAGFSGPRALPQVDGMPVHIVVGDTQAWLSWSAVQPTGVLRALAQSRFAQLHGRLASYRKGSGGDKSDKAALKESWDALHRLHTDLVSQSKWQGVLRTDGTQVSHPALTSPEDLFCEMTETIYWANDHWPFVRAELETADPELLELIRKLWSF